MVIDNPVDSHIGRRLRARRVALGMSPDTLAVALGISVLQVREWEAGKSRVGPARLTALAKFLCINPSWFFENMSVRAWTQATMH
jgi:transcriptional regulator with XRE-family HTH domain